MTDKAARDRILDCALALFSSRGYDHVGIAEVCATAEVTKPTLYYYFSSKDGLYQSLWQEKFEPLRQSLTTVAVYRPRPEEYQQDVLPVLAGIISVYIEFAYAQPMFFQLLSSLLFAPERSSAASISRGYRDFQLKLLQSLFTDIAHTHGNLAGKEPLLAAIFLGMVFSYIALDNPAHHGAETIARQFMHGIFS